MSEDNLHNWSKMANVPPEHLKPFSRSGGFRGTDIKPQWRWKIMTEVFGQCGIGWGMTAPNFQFATVANDQLVYCTVGVWTRSSRGTISEPVWGVGGDKLNMERGGKVTGDDEALKKAYTDALGNAVQKLGVAADVYMGYFDGSKYVKKTEDPDAPSTEEGETARKSAYAARKDGHYERINKGLDKISEEGSIEDLKAWWKANWKHITEMPEGWQDELTAKKDLIKAAFEVGLAKPLHPTTDPYADHPAEPYDPETGEIQ